MGDITFTREVNTVTFTATSNPSVTIVHEFQTADSGGDGTGDVTGPASSVDGRPAVFDGTTGKVIRQGNVNSPRGLVVLDDDGTIPDILVPASIARDSEVSSAISSATSGLVSSTDPRLSDARTPLGHTHGIDVLQTNDTDTTKVLTPNGSGGFKLAAAPSGGGAWQVISEQTLTSTAAAVSFTDLDDWAEIEIRWQGRSTAAADGSVYLNAICNGDKTAVYHRSALYRQSGFVNLNQVAQSAAWVGYMSGSQTHTDRWSSGVVRVACDQPATARKTLYGDFVCNLSPNNDVAVGQAAGVWANTTDPITTLTLSPSSGLFAAGCQFTLIGRTP